MSVIGLSVCLLLYLTESFYISQYLRPLNTESFCFKELQQREKNLDPSYFSGIKILKMFNRNNSRQQFWDKITLKLVSAVNKPLSINTHTHDLTPHSLNCGTRAGLDILVLVSSQGGSASCQSSVTGSAGRSCERETGGERQTGRQAEGGRKWPSG